MIIKVKYHNNEFDAFVVKRYPKGYLCFAQEKVLIVDFDFMVIESLDIICMVEKVF